MRLEVIKMVFLVYVLVKDFYFEVKVCVIVQYWEMFDQVLKFFFIVLDYDFNIMKLGQGLIEIICCIFEGLKLVLELFKFDVVLVYGDIIIIMVVSLVVFYQWILVGYVEVGLCIGDLSLLWLEEGNCMLIGYLVIYYFVFMEILWQNLLWENIVDSWIMVIGNMVIDVLFWVWDWVLGDEVLWEILLQCYFFISYGKKMILVIGYWWESFGFGFEQICQVLVEIVYIYFEVQIVYLVYLNFNVSELVNCIFGYIDNVMLIELQDYLLFVWLMDCVWLILIDFGGIQEEVFLLGKLVLVMCDMIECLEVVVVGIVCLVGIDSQCIVVEVM